MDPVLSSHQSVYMSPFHHLSFFTWICWLISIVTVIYSNFCLFVYKIRRINSDRHRARLCVQNENGT